MKFRSIWSSVGFYVGKRFFRFHNYEFETQDKNIIAVVKTLNHVKVVGEDIKPDVKPDVKPEVKPEVNTDVDTEEKKETVEPVADKLFRNW